MEGSQEAPSAPIPPIWDLGPLPVFQEESMFQRYHDRFSTFLVGLAVGLIILIPLCFADIAIFVVGIWGVHKCPVQDKIPVFLYVTGGTGIVSGFCSCIGAKPVECLLNIVRVVFYFLGSFWVFKEFPPNYNPEISDSNYCNKTVYLFSFIYLVVGYVILFLALMFILFIFCRMCYDKQAGRPTNMDISFSSRPIRAQFV